MKKEWSANHAEDSTLYTDPVPSGSTASQSTVGGGFISGE